MTTLSDPPVTQPFTAPVPIPPGRGRWRLTLHRRVFATNGLGTPVAVPTWAQTIVVELSTARGRRLEQQQNSPATLTFTLDGHDPSAAAILELQHDVMAWRWDETTGQDVCMFRGVIAQSEDQITEQSHTVTFTAHDYLAMLSRRLITQLTGLNFAQISQDVIARTLVWYASRANTISGGNLAPGSYLPIWVRPVGPDGTIRPDTTVLRDRQYAGGANFGELLDQLSAVQGGFDYDVIPAARTSGLGLPAGNDALRIFSPAQGVQRSDMMLVYGGNVSTVTRSVNSADYANYVRAVGNNGSSDPNVAQLAADAWNTDANNTAANGIGTWMSADNSSSDVNLIATLQQQVAGTIAADGILIPSYTLGLRPDTYRFGYPWMGDTVNLRIRSGRLDTNTPVRVVGIAYDINDDDDEDIALTVGRPAASFARLFTTIGRDINALARR
jgi:hypothetical protein